MRPHSTAESGMDRRGAGTTADTSSPGVAHKGPRPALKGSLPQSASNAPGPSCSDRCAWPGRAVSGPRRTAPAPQKGRPAVRDRVGRAPWATTAPAAASKLLELSREVTPEGRLFVDPQAAKGVPP